MARHLIQNAATGETRLVGDAALPFFPGFAIVDTYDDGIPPVVFYGAGEADLRYVNVTELSDPSSAASVALRAASVAAVEDADEVAPVGQWDFLTAPTVNGEPIGVGGGDGPVYEEATAADVAFTPTGTVAATNVQAAIAEVAAEASAAGAGVAPNVLVAGNRYATGKGTIGTLAMSLNREYAVRWDAADTVLDYLGAETTTAVASASLRFAVRAKATNGTPGAVVVEAAADGSAIGAVGVTIAPTTVHRGDWLTMQSQGAAATVRSTNYNDPYVPRPDALTSVGAGLFGVGNATGALPAAFSNSGVSASSPVFSAKVAV